jgi:hypothetical protein
VAEVQLADPATRRRALIVIAVIAVLGWGAWFGLEHWLAGLRGLDPAQQRDALERALVWAAWAAMLPVAALALGLWRYGTRVLRAGRFPAPGAKVIRDTAGRLGAPARARGPALRVFAALLGLLAAGTLIAVYRLLERLHP